MDNILPLLTQRVDSTLQGLLLLIGQRSFMVGVKTYAVGGLVRDILLNKVSHVQNGCDIDLTVEGDAISFAGEIQKILGGTLKTYPYFETAQISLKNGINLDFAAARQEFYSFPAAMPKVEKANIKKDLYRRDFTINTMAFSLLPHNYGYFFDYFGGADDLKDGIIKILYRLSFYDDPLRILRAIKFSQRFNFYYEKETLRLMHKAVNLRLLEKVSREKLYREVESFFLEPKPSNNLHELIRFNLFHYFFPRTYQLEEKKVVWERIEEMIPKMTNLINFDLINLYYLSLFYELTPEETSYLCNYMRLPQKRKASILTVINKYPEALRELSQPKPMQDAAIHSLLSPLPGEGLILLLTISTDTYLHKRVKDYLSKIRFRKLHLSGKDLIAMGMKPGIYLGKFLARLEKDVLNGKINSYHEEKSFARQYMQKYSSFFRGEE